MDRKTSMSRVLYEAAEESYELGYWRNATSPKEKKIVESAEKLLHDMMELQEML